MESVVVAVNVVVVDQINDHQTWVVVVGLICT